MDPVGVYCGTKPPSTTIAWPVTKDAGDDAERERPRPHGTEALTGVLFYLLARGFTVIGAFATVTLVRDGAGEANNGAGEDPKPQPCVGPK